MDKRQRLLQSRALRVAGLLEKIGKRDFGLLWIKVKPEDEIRLLRLAGWEEKYKVTISWILHQLVPIWRRKYAGYQAAGLGVSVATLTGKKSEEILKKRITEEYPSGENVAIWKAKEQDRQWANLWDEPVGKMDWTKPEETLDKYHRRMAKEREGRKAYARIAQRRKYRNNPWL